MTIPPLISLNLVLKSSLVNQELENINRSVTGLISSFFIGPGVLYFFNIHSRDESEYS